MVPAFRSSIASALYAPRPFRFFSRSLRVRARAVRVRAQTRANACEYGHKPLSRTLWLQTCVNAYVYCVCMPCGPCVPRHRCRAVCACRARVCVGVWVCVPAYIGAFVAWMHTWVCDSGLFSMSTLLDYERFRRGQLMQRHRSKDATMWQGMQAYTDTTHGYKAGGDARDGYGALLERCLACGVAQES